MRPDRPNGKQDSVENAMTLALMALGWTLAEESRADRLLALTGMDVETLRAGVGDPAVMGAILAFLANHEPDLIACAQAIDTTPAALIAAQEILTR